MLDAGSGIGGLRGISDSRVLEARTRDAAASKARVSSGVLPSVWDRRRGFAEIGRVRAGGVGLL